MLQKRGQYMDEKTIQRIKKLQALAERGVGGEKTTAQKKLAKLLKDNGINSLGISGISSTRTAAYSPHIRKIIKGGEYRGGYPKITLRACARVV